MPDHICDRPAQDSEANSAPHGEQELYTVEQLSVAEKARGNGAIRDDLFHRRTNGLEESGALVYRGRRILLHRKRYVAWLLGKSQEVRR
jgi:hypothetical protein